MAVGAALTGEPGDADPRAVRGAAGGGLAQGGAAEAIAAELAGMRELIVVASGVRSAGRAASWPSRSRKPPGCRRRMRDLETFLHGHLPAMDERTGLVLILADRDGRAARSARAQQAMAAAGRVGVRAAGILAADLDAEWPAFLLPGGAAPRRRRPPALPAPVAALVGTATPLQVLTERLARARGTDPDPIRRDQLAYREAATLAE